MRWSRGGGLDRIFDFLIRITGKRADRANSAAETDPDRPRRAELLIQVKLYRESGEDGLAARVVALAARLAEEQMSSRRRPFRTG